MMASRKMIDGWEDKSLGSLCCLINGFPFKPEDWGPDGKPIIRIQNLNGGVDYNCFAGEIDPKYEVDAGSMLFAWSGNRGTSFGPYVWSGPVGLLNQHIFKVVPSEAVHRAWFFYALDEVKERVERDAHGASGLVHVRKADLVKYPIALPKSLPEQTKIAEILSTVDRAIEQTEALIAKQQRLKTGLMQDLLTCGIDKHGNLRSEQTHEFKDSPPGRIPVEWEVKRIDELLANVDPPMRSGPFGSALLKEELVDAGVPLLGIDNVHTEQFVAQFSRFVHPKKAKTLKRYYVRPRDIMITIMGTVGRCCVVPDDIGTALSSKHTWTISLDQTVYSPYLACLQINHANWVLNHFAKDEQGGIMSSIKSDTLRSTLLPVPPRDEIMKIEARMKSLTGDYEIKADLLRKLHSLKTALMQDLLTGRKRVTDLLINEEDQT